MKVADVLTWGVVSVRPDDTLERAVALMLGERVSGLPVVSEAGELVGILTEGDLLRRAELGTEKRRTRWLEFLAGPGKLAEEYSQARGRRVAELMTERVVSIPLSAPLSEAVDLMTRNKVKRLPVVDGQRVVGILSRSDLLRALSRSMPAPNRQVSKPDADLLKEVEAEMGKLPFATGAIEIGVAEGVVRLTGAIMDERERNAIRIAAENVPGVRGVRDELVWMSPMALAPGL
ncbi:CBS domain-containing protein [Enterovirga rhinocerotis]|uniref:BON domain-containing protein n=1 Tax=Enterovirga rhinocerotis TaxID=1339210 RepID=A0A4R7BWZ1_9HYPH|nr:CBS domain-containing protein [Enterovirga rhinocerotis]TDR90023.1 BON domain-containing protein [Enterovirga rhinocerotis]